MSEMLKPCPFCNGNPEVKMNPTYEAQIICSSCGSRSQQALKTRALSIVERWNNRSPNNNNTLDSSGLKPCPFCGSKGQVKTLKGTFIVQCSKCLNGTAYFDTQDEAVKIWNSRIDETYASGSSSSTGDSLARCFKHAWLTSSLLR